MALTLKSNHCEICDGFVRKLVEIMVIFIYTYPQQHDGSQCERGWYSDGKRATSSVKELENEHLPKSM